MWIPRMYQKTQIMIQRKGAFNIYVNRILTFLDHLPTPSKQTQWIEKGDLPYKHKHLTDHLPTSSCLRKYWIAPKENLTVA